MNTIEVWLTEDNEPNYIYLIDGIFHSQQSSGYKTAKEAWAAAEKRVEELRQAKK